MAGGKKLQVEARDDRTVVITFPAPFAPGIRILDALPILPRHKLEAALKAGTFRQAWGLTTPLGDLAGLGPFVVSGYQPGQRLTFSRNERYFDKAADGPPLPYHIRIVLDIIPDQGTEIYRLSSGHSVIMTRAEYA